MPSIPITRLQVDDRGLTAPCPDCGHENTVALPRRPSVLLGTTCTVCTTMYFVRMSGMENMSQKDLN